MIVASLQFNIVDSEDREFAVEQNIAAAKNVIKSRADLFVLPELSFTPYLLTPQTAAEYSTPNITAMIKSAAISISIAHSAAVCCGFIERADDKMYNSMLVIDRGQIIKIYRKKKLFPADEKWAAAGSSFEYVDLSIGRAALGICMDINTYDWSLRYGDSTKDLAQFLYDNDCNFCIFIAAIPVWPGFTTAKLHYHWIQRLTLHGIRKPLILIAAAKIGREENEQYSGGSAIIDISKNQILAAADDTPTSIYAK